MTNNDVFEAHKLCMEAHLRVKKGGTLYVINNLLKLKENPDGSGRALGGAFAGEEVVWLGASPLNPIFQKIRFTVKNHRYPYNPPVGTVIEGWTHGANLSVCKPIMEVYSKNPMEKISSEAFASSGVGIKG